MTTYRTPDNRTYPAIGDPRTMDSGTYICLDVTLPNRPKSVRWFRRELLTIAEVVREPIAETVAEPAPKLVLEMTADMIGSFAKGKPGVDVSKSSGVDIRVVEPCKAIVLWQPVTEWRHRSSDTHGMEAIPDGQLELLPMCWFCEGHKP